MVSSHSWWDERGSGVGAGTRCVECGRTWEAVQRTGRPRRYCSRSCQARAYRRRRDRGRSSTTGRSAPDDALPSATVEGAIALADSGGVATVTLRAVAQRTGASLSSLQREAGSRDRLVSMMVHRILSRRTVSPTADESPVQVLERLAEAEWRTYRAHPWMVAVLASTRPPLVPSVLDAAQQAVEAFVALGLDAEDAFARYLALSAFVQGMALLLAAEERESAGSGTSLRAWWAQESRRLDRTGALRRHPWLAERSASAAAFEPDAMFREGLDLVLRGLVRSDGR